MQATVEQARAHVKKLAKGQLSTAVLMWSGASGVVRLPQMRRDLAGPEPEGACRHELRCGGHQWERQVHPHEAALPHVRLDERHDQDQRHRHQGGKHMLPLEPLGCLPLAPQLQSVSLDNIWAACLPQRLGLDLYLTSHFVPVCLGHLSHMKVESARLFGSLTN